MGVAVKARTYGGLTADARRATRRSALIEAALDLLAEGGPQAVSKRAVCTRARLNDRYFYESFADTNALLEAIVREQTALGLEAVSAVTGDSTDLHSQIRSIARIALDFLTEDPRRAALLLSSRASDVLQRARNDSTHVMADAMSAIAGDELEPTDVSRLDRQLASYALVSGTMELIEAWLRGEFETTREHLADHIAGLLAATSAITATLPSSNGTYDPGVGG